ncbi:MAG: DEAD/DEAH box helicase family protein, partial [Nanoarchaeota archaeon]
PKSCEYRTGTENEPLEFFLEALSNSNQFDILLGYFSSTAINVLSYGFAKFIANGGEARLIINHFLSKEDKEAIARGETHEPEVFYSHKPTFEEINKNLDERGVHFFNCLAWLVSKGKLNIRLIRPKGSGIAHYKSGIFRDGSSAIKFKGSCNFTATALIENLEELDIKCSWKSKEDISSIKDYEEYFENIYNKQSDFVEYLPIDKAVEVIRNNYGDKTLDELLIDEAELIKKKAKKYNQNIKLRKKLEKINKDLISITNEPKFPFDSEPRDYQVEAYENWVKNDYKGIFAMATGTGKTITALNCLLQEYKKYNTYRAIILVPTKLLVNQWEEELKKFNFINLFKISSKSNWAETIGRLLTSLSFDKDKSFAIISTYASFYKQKFQSYFKQLPLDTILIADEAHNIASPKVKKVLPNVRLTKRIALSATPKRAYDEEGNDVIEDFFNSKEPYTYNYSMEEAIENGVLTKYYYYPHLIYLTDEELEDYINITEKLIKYFNQRKNIIEKNEIVKTLLMQRKRIIHKAYNKLEVYQNIIRNKLEKDNSIKYTFVYVPEGYKNIEEQLEFSDEEEKRVIDQYIDVVYKLQPQIKAFPFLGETSNKQKILKQFANGDIDLLASMKCLDEGVDVPRTEFAIFCSSTGNPRQFIQRRGRILRKHNDKHLATIHDLVVLPNYKKFRTTDANFKLEKKLIKTELERVVHFASMAINSYEAFQKFDDVCDYYNLNIYSIKETLSN